MAAPPAVDQVAAKPSEVAAAEKSKVTIVTVAYDDAIKNEKTIGAKTLDDYDLCGTFFIITGDDLGDAADDPNLETMNRDDLADLYKSKRPDGSRCHELGNHTSSHPDLTAIPDDQLDRELKYPPLKLAAWLGVSPDIDPYVEFGDCASPEGQYNDHVLVVIEKYCKSHVKAQNGFDSPESELWNSLDGVDEFQINRRVIRNLTLPKEVNDTVDRAAAKGNVWLVLGFHGIVETPSTEKSDRIYQVTAENHKKIIEHLKELVDQGKIRVMTVREALAIIPHKAIVRN
jgi:peptidoglycan/xylan/chitin deacetylase (PgdA/CDA1 family)